ncbi:MAG TPA: prohead protease/major capsid protein fusion protein [Sphingomonas sp.]|jgi:HK97 family phage prohead protease|uniref:prohead protease/major capsid protein fusion protein n=1 Tax=Sphingomonas sp. TaxID=28214 RepID=UPI002EDB13B7
MTEPNPARQRAADRPRADGEIVTAPLPPMPSKRKAALLAGVLLGSAVAGILTREAPAPQGDPAERRQPQTGGRGTRALSVTPDSYNAEARTVEAILSAGSPVRRYYFTEELEISAEAIDLGRVERGICPLLDTHNQYELGAVLGRISGVRIENEQLIGTLHFSDTEAGRAVEARVAAGELRAISIGYRVTKWQITATDENEHETWRAVAWELLEASLVPVPADPNAVVRSNTGTPAHGTEEEDDMNRNLPGGGVAHPNANRGAAQPAQQPASQTTVVVEPDGSSRTEPNSDAAPAAQRSPTIAASRILELCARTEELGATFANDLIRDSEAGTLTEAAMHQRIGDHLVAARQRPSIDARAAGHSQDEDAYRQALSDAVSLRANPTDALDDDPARPAAQRLLAARDFRGMTLMELARFHLGRTGVDTRGMGRLDIAGAALGMRFGAMTTSDFANALSYATNRRVRAAFAAAPQTFRPFVSTGTLPDFKPTQIVGLGDAPALLLVPEMGEFKRGAVTDTGLTYRLQTYGRVIAISRQAIVNDDKDLFGRIPTMFGRKAADLESDLVYGTLLGNPTMGDNQPLFSVAAGNLALVGTAITVASVSAGETAMLQQKNDEGGFLTIRPEFLIVGPLQKVAAQAFLTAVAAGKTADVNPYPGNLQLIVDPRITGYQWLLSASPDAFDTMVLAHLDGQEELFTETRVGFDVDGVENKARLDVGAAVVDRRGFYRNPGAAPA